MVYDKYPGGGFQGMGQWDAHFFKNSKMNGHYCDTYCGAPESVSAPDDHVRASHLPVIGTIESPILNIKYPQSSFNI